MLMGIVLKNAQDTYFSCFWKHLVQLVSEKASDVLQLDNDTVTLNITFSEEKKFENNREMEEAQQL